jgi:thioredoxin 1
MTVIKHYGAEQWCAPCRALKPVIQEIISQNPSVSYQYIDVDSNQAEATSAGIRSIPVVIVEKNGVETSRFVGIQSKAVYEQAIK